jgi:hypothetical protein
MVIAALALLSLTAGVSNDGLITIPSSAVVSDTRIRDQQPQQPAPAGSDAPAEERKPPPQPHTGIKALVSGFVEDVRHVPSPQNGYLALVGGGLALAAHQADTSFNQHLRSAIGGRTVTQHGRQVWTFVPVSVPGGMAIVAMRTP